MEKFYELKTINAIERNVVSFPIKPLIDQENNKITFSFVEFAKMKEHLQSICDNFTTEHLNERNVAIYEKDNASVKKVAELIKKSAQAYVDEFALELLGRHRGNNRVKGQVDELVEILMNKYNEVHTKTKEIREALKNANSSNETEETINNTCQVVLTLDKAFMSDLKAFCKERKIKIGEII